MRKIWTDDERRVLSALYSDTDIKEICRILDRSDRSIYTQAHLLGLKRSKEYMKMLLEIEAKRLREVGNQSRFQPGHTTWNKGAKGYMGSNATSFKKGHKPHNTRNKGETSRDKEGYLLVKIGNRKWIRKHKLIWEETNGPIPKGHVIKIKDKNKENYSLENIELITQAENMKRNAIHRYPEELKKTIRALTKLKKTIRKNGKK